MDDKYVAKLLKTMVAAKLQVYIKDDLAKEADRIAKDEAKKFLKLKQPLLRKAVLDEFQSMWPEMLKGVVDTIVKKTKFSIPATYRRYY